MKVKILSLLKKQFPEYLSGEEISRKLGVSRTAVWKHVNKLRESGYQIESHPKVGYRLLFVPDRIDEFELAELISGRIIGRNIIVKERVNSTNELAKRMALEGSPEGTVVIADEQTGGKGRLGRVWYSPAGQGLWFSIILRPQISPVDAAKLTIVSAVALAKTVREFVGIPAGIKWPNDLYVNGRKLAGILTEMNAEMDRVNFLVVGIGMNTRLVNSDAPPEINGIATSLEEQKGDRIEGFRVLAAILNNLDSLYRDFLDGHFARILLEWKEMSVTLNQMVTISSFNSVEEGMAVDIDADGALLLRKADRTLKRILSGDVSLRPVK